MTKYIQRNHTPYRLTGFSQRDIMASCGVAQKTVVKVQKCVKELNLFWSLEASMTDNELHKRMFSKENTIEYSRAVKPSIRQTGNRLFRLTETAYASKLT